MGDPFIVSPRLQERCAQKITRWGKLRIELDYFLIFLDGAFVLPGIVIRIR